MKRYRVRCALEYTKYTDYTECLIDSTVAKPHTKQIVTRSKCRRHSAVGIYSQRVKSDSPVVFHSSESETSHRCDFSFPIKRNRPSSERYTAKPPRTNENEPHGAFNAVIV